MENVNFIFKFSPSSYIQNLLEIVLKLKIKTCWPQDLSIFENSGTELPRNFTTGASSVARYETLRKPLLQWFPDPKVELYDSSDDNPRLHHIHQGLLSCIEQCEHGTKMILGNIGFKQVLKLR